MTKVLVTQARISLLLRRWQWPKRESRLDCIAKHGCLVVDTEQLNVAIVVLMTVTLGFTKMSAIFFYRRIFCVGHYSRSFHILSITSIVIVGCWLITFPFLAGFQCGTHFSALWNGTYAQYCYLSFPYLYGLAISDFLLDVWILVLPVPLVR